MIFSGWIMHDLHEVKCTSVSIVNGHEVVVKRYLNVLEIKYPKEYEKVIQLYKIFNGNLEDFAITVLGWIKIVNQPKRVIIFSDYACEKIIEKYENLGFDKLHVFSLNHMYRVSIPSYKIL